VRLSAGAAMFGFKSRAERVSSRFHKHETPGWGRPVYRNRSLTYSSFVFGTRAITIVLRIKPTSRACRKQMH
jgi:hypothetical protein